MKKNHESKFVISGKVIPGLGLGNKLGYPTANIDRRDYARQKLSIKPGIWSGVAEVQNLKLQKKFPSAIVIEKLQSQTLPKIEAHIIGFKGNLYGKKIILELKKYLRPFKKFKNTETLKKQISKDVNKVINS